MVITARALSGLANGNVGILRTVVAELVPQKKVYIRFELFVPERETA